MYLCKREYKIYLWFVMIGVFSLTGQQEDRKRLAISPFEKLKISSNIEVNLIQSEANMLLVYGKNSDNITVSIKNRELKINLIGGSILNNEKTKIDLYHRSTIEKILVKKGATLSSKYPFKQEKLIIEAKTNGNISLELFADKLKTKISLGGRVCLNGKVDTHKLEINTSSICEAEKLNTKKTILISKAGAFAYINSKTSLKAKIYGGVIREFGNPEEKDIENRLGGKIYIEK